MDKNAFMEPFDFVTDDMTDYFDAEERRRRERAAMSAQAARTPSPSADAISPMEPFTAADDRVEGRPASAFRRDVDAWRRGEGGPELQSSFMLPVASAVDQALSLGKYVNPKGLYDLTTALPGAIVHAAADAATLPGDAVTGRDPNLFDPETGRMTLHGGQRVANLVTSLPLGVGAARVAGANLVEENAAGMFGGRLAKTADHGALARAEGLPFDDKLAVMHNLTEGNLAFADQKFGGKLPVPSIAIAKGGHPIEGFGDVSLIGEPAMVKPSASNPVFAADAYTKRFPNTALDFPTREAERVAKKRLELELGREVSFSEMEYLKDGMKRDELNRDALLAEAYLRQKGVDVPQDEYMIKRKADEIGGFDSYANSFFDDDLVRRRIFKYSENTGNRINKPFTLENVVKEMKGGANTEGFRYGMGDLRASITPKFRTIDGIQDARHRLQDSDVWSADSKAIEADIEALVRDLPKRAGSGSGNRFTDYDYQQQGVHEAIKNPSRARQELSYQFDADNLPPDTHERLVGLRNRIRSLGTDYFEAKPQRGVGINEFAGALVSEKSAGQVSDLLKRYGIDNIATYDGTPAGRQEALKRFERIMFVNGDDRVMPGLAVANGALDGEFSHATDAMPFNRFNDARSSGDNVFGRAAHVGQGADLGIHGQTAMDGITVDAKNFGDLRQPVPEGEMQGLINEIMREAGPGRPISRDDAAALRQIIGEAKAAGRYDNPIELFNQLMRVLPGDVVQRVLRRRGLGGMVYPYGEGGTAVASWTEGTMFNPDGSRFYSGGVPALSGADDARP